MEIIESEALLALDQLYPGALRTLKTQVERGHQFLLATVRHNPRAAMKQIAHLGITGLARQVIVVDSHDRQTKSAATRDCGLHAVVGDTEIDHHWARDLDIPFYASGFGFRSPYFGRTGALSATRVFRRFSMQLTIRQGKPVDNKAAQVEGSSPIDLGWSKGQLPIAEHMAQTVLSLSLSPQMTDTEVDAVIRSVRSGLRE